MKEPAQKMTVGELIAIPFLTLPPNPGYCKAGAV